MLLLTPPMTTSSSGPHSKSSGRSALHSSPSGRAGGGVSTLFRSSPGDGGALKKAAVVAKRTGSQLAIIRGLIAPPPAGRACSGVMRPNMDRESRARCWHWSPFLVRRRLSALPTKTCAEVSLEVSRTSWSVPPDEPRVSEHGGAAIRLRRSALPEELVPRGVRTGSRRSNLESGAKSRAASRSQAASRCCRRGQ